MSDAVAVVTGGGSGLGQALALGLAKNHRVVVTDIDEVAAHGTLRQIREAGGRGEVHFSWVRRDDGRWAAEAMWGRTSRSGAPVEKSLDHLATGSYDTEAECRAALERAARSWLYEHQ